MTADDTVTAKLAEWEALAEGATPGPWEASVDASMIGSHFAVRDATGRRVYFRDGLTVTSSGEFIAHARTAMPALLGFVREVREGHEREVIGEEAWCPRCQHRWPCPIERATRKWLGGEG